MKYAYRRSQYGRPYERLCRERYPGEAADICRRADARYRGLLTEMPDLGRNRMANNMLDWYTIVAFYEASGHRLDGEALLEIKRRETERLRFLSKLVDGNRCRWPYRLFDRTFAHFERLRKQHQARGEWMDTWRVERNPDHRTEGCCFHLVGCPIAKHAKENGYETLLPYLCRTDHFLAELMHARLVRTRTEALGGDCCDYWYVGDKSPALEPYRDLERI